jgi:hypothetical protein
MTIARFPDVAATVDESSVELLATLVALGGYCTAAQLKQLSVPNLGRITRARVRAWERAGLLRKVAAYPVVYQVTKSTTCLLDHDSGARRRHTLATVQARLLAVNFYLEARWWPAEFILDHKQKVATFTEAGCPSSALPQRGGKPYLWEDFVLWLVDGRIGVAIVDQPHSSTFSQLRHFIRRFGPLFQHIQNKVQSLITTGNHDRARLYDRLLREPIMRNISPVKLEAAIRPYCLQESVLTVARLQYVRSKPEDASYNVPLTKSDEPSELLVCDALVHNS